MGVDVADAEARESVPLDEMHHFLMRGDLRLGHVLQRRQNRLALPQIAQRQFTDDKRMRQHAAGIEQAGKAIVTRPQMIDPDRRIGEDHAGSGRRRAAGVSLG